MLAPYRAAGSAREREVLALMAEGRSNGRHRRALAVVTFLEAH